MHAEPAMDTVSDAEAPAAPAAADVRDEQESAEASPTRSPTVCATIT